MVPKAAIRTFKGKKNQLNKGKKVHIPLKDFLFYSTSSFTLAGPLNLWVYFIVVSIQLYLERKSLEDMALSLESTLSTVDIFIYKLRLLALYNIY